MKMLLLALTLLPTLALADLDDSVANGASTTTHIVEMKEDNAYLVAASLVKDESRIPASTIKSAENFKFPTDGYDAGTSVK